MNRNWYELSLSLPSVSMVKHKAFLDKPKGKNTFKQRFHQTKYFEQRADLAKFVGNCWEGKCFTCFCRSAVIGLHTCSLQVLKRKQCELMFTRFFENLSIECHVGYDLLIPRIMITKNITIIFCDILIFLKNYLLIRKRFSC